MKHQVLFSLKNNEKVFMNVVCCSRDRRFKGKANNVLNDTILKYWLNSKLFSCILCCRLDESTYTIDEVTDMLDGLLSVVRSEVEDEFINAAHTNVLLMRQMFIQAEKWHLKLQADISELENR